MESALSDYCRVCELDPTNTEAISRQAHHKFNKKSVTHNKLDHAWTIVRRFFLFFFGQFLSVLITPHWKVLRGYNLCHSAPLEILFPMALLLFFAWIKFFRFWPKTVDYSKVF